MGAGGLSGQVALFVNLELLKGLSVPLQVEPGSCWKIQLAGAAVDPCLCVRSLTVCPGEG